MSLDALLAADFATRPYNHQCDEFERHADASARAMAWHMRTGKTKAVIDKACHLFKGGKIDGVLVFAPNGVHANWVERELPIHNWPSVPINCLVWRSAVAGSKRVNQLAKRDRAAWYAARDEWWKVAASFKKDRRLLWLTVNSESMTRADVRKAVARFLKHRRVFLVVDESDDFGTPGTQRTKMIRSLARKCPYRTILSGTMLTGNLLAAFPQFEILEKGALGFNTYDEFKARYAVYEQRRARSGRAYPALVGYQNEEELREKIARFTSVVLREDCGDMPNLVRDPLHITPTQQQNDAFEKLRRQYIIDLEENRIDVGERAPRFQKLQQVFSGFIIDANKKVIRIPGPNPRLDALSNEVYFSPGKVLVWCNFQVDMDMVRERLLSENVEIYEYHGRVSDKAKAYNLTRFRETKAKAALVGHCKSGGRGQDFSVASSVFWYSHTFSARLREQAMERATKIGGKNIRVVDFLAPGPDQYIVSTTERRVNVADAIAGRGLRDLLRGMAL